MDDLKRAYELLGLSENASREEVEKAFDLLLRRSRSRRPNAQGDGESEENEYDLQLKAYKTIVEYEERSKIDEMSRKRYGKWGKFAGNAEKVDDFFRLHKTKVIIGIIAVIALVVGITAFINHREEQKRLAALPPIDLSIMFVGNYMTDQNQGGDEGLEKAMTAQFPEWKRLKVILTYLPSQGEGGGTADLAYQQKAMAMVATEKPDVYILDENSFDWLGGGGVLEKLDTEANGVLKPLLGENSIKVGRTEEETEDHVYGIRVTDSPLAKQLPLAMQDMIITVRIGSDNKDKAIHLIERYLEPDNTAK
ncbi:molecular chaperone DnaJ [Fontibacillus sp. BL9]|uniref:molecular chaperone DnaJ n=1 Tax=Fontibacillus sp. BL9 TaxID=3389971 RepID=UPI00397C5DED